MLTDWGHEIENNSSRWVKTPYIWVNIGSGNTGGNGLLDDGTKSFLMQ